MCLTASIDVKGGYPPPPSRSKIYLSPSSQWRGTIHYAIIPSVRKLEQSRHKHDVTFAYAEDIGG